MERLSGLDTTLIDGDIAIQNGAGSTSSGRIDSCIEVKGGGCGSYKLTN
jgi:hypothetical protein